MILCMKSLQAPNLKTIILTKAMYTVICSYDKQAFDNMSEESENNNFIVKKSLRPVPSQGMVEQAKKHGNFRPQQGYLGNALRSRYFKNVLGQICSRGSGITGRRYAFYRVPF